MKYSINGTGNIVAERDIYSLGGFIPKGSVGGKIASEEQLSQDGDCWLAGGDISDRPDIVIKDNAYVGTFTPGANPVHTDGITEFSGNTIIPGKIIVRNPIADPVNNFYAKDSFIGVSMDVLCGPATTTTAFPFEQGRYDETRPKGTLFVSGTMKVDSPSSCRCTATVRIGRGANVYVPTGYTVRVLWAYYDTSNQLAYAGETEVFQPGLNKLNNPVYKMCMLSYHKADITPATLLASGAKVLGHISNSVTTDIRPESASGQYVMDNSSLLFNTDNFGLTTTQLRFFAGSMQDTTMYVKADTQDYKLFGTFRNVERLEYNQYFAGTHRENANRDRYIVASDCPLVRVEAGTITDSIVNAGGVTLRRCIVPKASFTHDAVNGNVYEDIDFSYANEFIRNIVAGRNLYSSHREGLYACESNGELLGLISYPGNMDSSARTTGAHDYRPLDGNIIEQGTYYGELVHYEAAKHDETTRVRTRFPLPTRGAIFPELPAGFGVRAILYLDDNFVCKLPVTDPVTIESTYPYYVMAFKRDNLNGALSAKDFIALGATLRSSNYNVTPEITGSAYVGAGVTVRGDVKLIGDPYVNRVFDVNMWERGTTLDGAQPNYPTWEDRKVPTAAGNSFRFINQIPVEPGAKITCNPGYWVLCYFFDGNGNYLSSPGWGQIGSTAPANSAFAGVVIKKADNAADAGGLIEDSDIPLANVKYLRAFEKRRYITNELDRTSPKDILLGLDLWMKNSVSTSEANKGKYFKELIGVSNKYLISKSPINAGSAWSVTTGVPATYAYSFSSWDAVTKFLGGGTAANVALMEVEIRAQSGVDLSLSDAFNARIVIEFTPSPRIVVPYGASGISVNGMKIRMYDNAVLSRNLNQQGEIVLQGDAVMGYDFNSGSCMCSNGHSDAIIKLP